MKVLKAYPIDLSKDIFKAYHFCSIKQKEQQQNTGVVIEDGLFEFSFVKEKNIEIAYYDQKIVLPQAFGFGKLPKLYKITIPLEHYSKICCFDKFINDLPNMYKRTIKLVYIEGKKQNEAAEILNISLANIKARIRRAKEILKEKFNICCKYEFDKNGNLVGEPNCSTCQL